MALKNHDFIEIDYTGRIKESGEVFDTTDAAVAKKEGIFQEGAVFGTVTICLGEGFIMHGLEKKLEGKELGDYEIALTQEEGFGKKSAKLIQLVPTAKFTKEKIHPMPGLQINIDGMLGTVKTVTGGRTVVDFNHPLSGKDLIYKVSIKKLVFDDLLKANAVLKWHFRIEKPDTKLEKNTLTIHLHDLPKEFKDEITKKIIALTSITEVKFEEHKEFEHEAKASAT